MKNKGVCHQGIIVYIMLFASNVSGLTRGASSSNPIAREHTSRQAMESIEELAERLECVPFADIPTHIVSNVNNDVSCFTNGCSSSTSCCRVLTDSLYCDENNENPYFRCICSDFTRTHHPTESPIEPSQSPTSQQSDPQLDAPTESPNVGNEPSGNPLDAPTREPTTSPQLTSEPTNVKEVSQSSQQDETAKEERRLILIIVGGALTGLGLMIIGCVCFTRRTKTRAQEKELSVEPEVPLAGGALGRKPKESDVEPAFQLTGSSSSGSPLPDWGALEQNPKETDVESEVSEHDLRSKKETSPEAQPDPWCADGFGDTCNTFSGWFGSSTSIPPKRVKSFETKDTVEL
eukprot:scaffold818_cov136-Cylindrotheca_fusiformis.AAC.23